MTPRPVGPLRPPLTEAEIAQLFGRILEMATRYALEHVSPDDADDVAQLVATQIVEACIADPTYLDQQGPINAFVYECMINRTKNLRRSRSRAARYNREHLSDQEDSVHGWSDPDAEQRGEETELVIGLAINRMPPWMRLVYTIVREGDRTYEEIGAALGIAVGSVHTQLSRGNALVRRIGAEYRSEGIISLEERRRKPGREPKEPQASHDPPSPHDLLDPQDSQLPQERSES